MKSAFQNTFRTRSSTRSRTRDARHFERILERVTGSDQLNRNQFDNTRNWTEDWHERAFEQKWRKSGIL